MDILQTLERFIARHDLGFQVQESNGILKYKFGEAIQVNEEMYYKYYEPMQMRWLLEVYARKQIERQKSLMPPAVLLSNVYDSKHERAMFDPDMKVIRSFSGDRHWITYLSGNESMKLFCKEDRASFEHTDRFGSPIHISLHGAFIAWCLASLDVPYFPKFYGYTHYGFVKTFYEAIEGKTLAEFITASYATVDDAITIILQVIYALHLAYEKFKFTHYDLHSKNIIVTLLNDPVEVEMSFGDKNYQVRTRCRPVIVDYDYSFVEYNGEKFGHLMQDYSNFNIHTSFAYPAHDIYRFLSNIMLLVRQRNAELYVTMYSYFKFFGEDEFNSRYETFTTNSQFDIRDIFHILPGEHREVTYEDFLNFAFDLAEERDCIKRL